jgi:hypothetical protein
MKTHNPSKKATMLAIVLAFLGAGALAAQPHGDQLVGTIANMEGGGTAPVVIHIDHYSSDQEVANLKGILADKGPDALRDALWDLEAGYIRVKGGLGYPVAVARSKPEADGGRVIRLMIDRPISFREAANNLRSMDYPFSYIEIHFDASGQGEGKLIAAAKVSLAGNAVEIESLGSQPFKLLDVHTAR